MDSPNSSWPVRCPTAHSGRVIRMTTLLVGLLLASTALSQGPPNTTGTKAQPQPSKNTEGYAAFWYGNHPHAPHAAAALAVGAPDPWLRLALAWAGQADDLWAEHAVADGSVPPLKS